MEKTTMNGDQKLVSAITFIFVKGNQTDLNIVNFHKNKPR
jgi:hypothetical protein